MVGLWKPMGDVKAPRIWNIVQSAPIHTAGSCDQTGVD